MGQVRPDISKGHTTSVREIVDMRILDQDSDKAIRRMLVLLTPTEAAELKNDLDRILQGHLALEHAHIDDQTFEHEITVAVYTNEVMSSFDERTKLLIERDE